MIPLSDENPTLRTPVVTYTLVAAIVICWLGLQGAGIDGEALAMSVCRFGLIPGEISGLAELGSGIQLGPNFRCAIDSDLLSRATPVTSMFMHGSWAHLLGNLLFLWVFGNNIEDSMGRIRFFVFYVLCGLIAAAAQVAIQPASPIPMVGASGAIAGVMGAYLVLYPRVRVNMLFIFIIFIRVIPLPAWLVLVYWMGIQLVTAVPTMIDAANPTGGVAVMAHIGGFIAGVVLIKIFENKALSSQHARGRWRK